MEVVVGGLGNELSVPSTMEVRGVVEDAALGVAMTACCSTATFCQNRVHLVHGEQEDRPYVYGPWGR